MVCFLFGFSIRGILYGYRRVCTVRGEMCGFPLTRSDRRRRHRHCCVLSPAPPLPHRPSLPFLRSNGSRGVPSGILLTTHTHTLARARAHTHIRYSHVAAVPARLCILLYIHTYVRIRTSILRYTLILVILLRLCVVNIFSRSRPPRLGHVGTKVLFIALLAIPLLTLPPRTLLSASPLPWSPPSTHRRRWAPRACVRECTYYTH